MRDLFETLEPANPVEAARRGGQTALRRRFYAEAAAVTTAEGHLIHLDGKPARTPLRRLLVVPNLPLAQAIAAEWQAQPDLIDPAKMPLSRLANVVIDGVAGAPAPVAAEIEKYLSSDLLFYRADAPAELCARQERHWDPILAWARDALGARFKAGNGVVYVAQPDDALKAARTAIPADPWRLGATHVLTTLTGSALIALALGSSDLSAEAAWQAAHVDEDWNMEQWGQDEMALQRRESRHGEFQAAVALLKM